MRLKVGCSGLLLAALVAALGCSGSGSGLGCSGSGLGCSGLLWAALCCPELPWAALGCSGLLLWVAPVNALRNANPSVRNVVYIVTR